MVKLYIWPNTIKDNMSKQKKILMTAGRSWVTLDLSRQLHAAGHKIYIAETSNYHVCRLSKAVEKSFIVPSPRFEPEKFIDSLVDIVKREKIDFLLPICEEIFYISKSLDRFPSHCTVMCSPFDIMHTLHNKWRFMQLLKDLDMNPPETHLITCREDLKNIPFKKPYILKPCYSRGSQKIKKVTPPQQPPILEIESFNPWVAQEWIEGKRYCTYGICHNGVLSAHSIYPVGFAVDGNSCVMFESIDHKGILAWVKEFVQKINFTGQIAFDFIEDERGLFAIECNPRATSGAHLFTRENIDKALFQPMNETIVPTPGAKRQLAVGMLIYGWRQLPENKTFLDFLKNLLTVKDVILRFSDLIPVAYVPFLFVHYMALSKRLGIRVPSTFTYDLEWNGERYQEALEEVEELPQIEAIRS